MPKYQYSPKLLCDPLPDMQLTTATVPALFSVALASGAAVNNADVSPWRRHFHHHRVQLRQAPCILWLLQAHSGDCVRAVFQKMF